VRASITIAAASPTIDNAAQGRNPSTSKERPVARTTGPVPRVGGVMRGACASGGLGFTAVVLREASPTTRACCQPGRTSPARRHESPGSVHVRRGLADGRPSG
jgi:hypothetical protein